MGNPLPIPLATVMISALDFISNQNGARIRTGLAERLHEFCGGYLDAAYSLDAFNDHSADVSFAQLLLHGIDVVQRKINYVAVVVDGGNDSRIVGCFYCQRGSSVKGFLKGYHFGAAIVERSQLQCIFVCLRTAVDQKEAIVVIA